MLRERADVRMSILLSQHRSTTTSPSSTRRSALRLRPRKPFPSSTLPMSRLKLPSMVSVSCVCLVATADISQSVQHSQVVTSTFASFPTSYSSCTDQMGFMKQSLREQRSRGNALLSSLMVPISTESLSLIRPRSGRELQMRQRSILTIRIQSTLLSS